MSASENSVMKMNKSNHCPSLLRAVILSVLVVGVLYNSGTSQSVQKSASVAIPDQEYMKVYSLLYPRASENFKPLESEFAIDILIRPNLARSVQLSVTQRRDGTVSATLYKLADSHAKANIDIRDLFDEATVVSPEVLRSKLEVEKIQLVNVRRLMPTISKFFRPFILPKTKSISLDGTGYDISYVDSGNRISFSMDGGEVFERGEPTLISWSRDLIRLARSGL